MNIVVVIPAKTGIASKPTGWSCILTGLRRGKSDSGLRRNDGQKNTSDEKVQ